MPISPDFSSIGPTTPSITPSFGGSGGIQGATDVSNLDPNSVGGLLNIADQQGGSVAAQAQQLANPNAGILSTISQGFQHTFSTFVKTISAPSEIEAGLIAGAKGGDGNVVDAIKNGTDVYSALGFGNTPDPNESILQKIGGFVVRTGVDILTDPTTYIGDPPWQLLAKDAAPLFGDAAKAMSVEEGTKVAFNEAGQAISQQTRSFQNFYKNNLLEMGHAQALGTAMAKFFQTGNPIFNPAGQDLTELLKNTIDVSEDSLQGKNFVGKQMSNLLSQHPALVDTLMDKGGLKILGKTVIEGASIRNAIQMIPGMSYMDRITNQPRMMLASLFNPWIKKDLSTGLYTRVPEELKDMLEPVRIQQEGARSAIRQSWKDFADGHNLNIDEVDIVRKALDNFKPPAHPKLMKAWSDAMGYAPGEFQKLSKAGVAPYKMDGYVFPHTWVPEKNQIPNFKGSQFKNPVNESASVLKHADLAKFIEQGHGVMGTGEAATEQLPKEIEALKNVKGGGENLNPENFTKVYRGGEPYDAAKVVDRGVSLASQKHRDVAESFINGDKGNIKNGVVQELNLSKNAKMLDVKDAPEDLLNGYKKDDMVAGREKIAEYAKKNGYDGVDFTSIGDFEKRVFNPSVLKTNEEVKNGSGLIGRIRASGSPQEAAIALGEHLNNRMNELTTGKNAMTFENAMQHPEIKTMMDARNALDSLPQNHTFVGKAEDFGLTPTDETGSNFIDTNGKNYHRVAAGLDELDAAGFKGFEHNFMFAMMHGQMEGSKAILAHSLLEDFAKTFMKPLSQAPEGWREVNVKGVDDAAQRLFSNVLSKDGEKMVAHPFTAQLMEETVKKMINDDPTQDLLKAFDKMQGVWKASVTSIFAQFHGRNLITHAMNSALDIGLRALDPATNAMAAQFVKHDMEVSQLTKDAYGIGQKALDAHGQLQDLLSKTMFTDNTGKDWSYGELRQMVKDFGVSFGHDAGSTEDIMMNDEDFKKSMMGQSTKNGKWNPLSQNFQPFAQGRKVGSILANQQRMVNFVTNLKATGNVELAAARTKQYLFDYGALTNFEKTVMRRIIPFYTFTRKNIALQARAIMETPGRITAELHSIQNLGDVMSGNNKLSPSEEASLPDWIKTGAQVLAKKQGENVTLLQGLPLPIEQPFSALQPNSILGSVSPLLRVPIEQATGYSFFQGKAISDITNAAGYVHAPGIIKKAIGFTQVNGKTSAGQPFTEYVALNPSVMNLFNNLPPTSRVMSSLKEIQESGADNDTNAQRIMEQLIGAKYYSFDLTQQAQIQQNQLKTELQDMLTKAGVTATYTQASVKPQVPPAPAPKPTPPFGQIAQAADLIF